MQQSWESLTNSDFYGLYKFIQANRNVSKYTLLSVSYSIMFDLMKALVQSFQYRLKASQVYTCRQAYPMLIGFISWILDNSLGDVGYDQTGQADKKTGLFFRRNPDYKNQLSICNF